MFLYRLWQSPTPHANGRNLLSASLSTSRRSDSEILESSLYVRPRIEVGEMGAPPIFSDDGVGG
jgi:hypothetical protein